jgi:hypothetical protein
MFELSKFRKANAQIQGKGVFKCEGTFYHLTPNDLGKNVNLEPRQPQIEDFKSLCVANYLVGCFVSFPEDKINNDTLYLYRNYQPGTAYRQFLNNGQPINEAKIFEKTKFIRIGKITNCLKLFEELRKYFDSSDIIQWDEIHSKENFSSYITIEKEQKTSIILFGYSKGKYELI